MAQPITDAAQALAGLLRAAEDGALPMPHTADVRRYAPHGHEAYEDGRLSQGGICVALNTLVDLTQWAVWLGEPIDDKSRTETAVHYNVYGYAGPFPVNVFALVPIAESVSA